MKKTLKWNIAQKAELKWWENYLKGKNVDQYHTWKKAYWQKGALNNQGHILPTNFLPAEKNY